MEKEKISESTIDIIDLTSFLWSKKIFICALTFCIGISSILYSLILTNEYTAVLSLSEVKQDEETSLSSSIDSTLSFSLPGGFGVGNGLSNDMNQAITLMKSWGFVDDFIRKNNLEVPLIAGKYWDESTRKLVIDESIYDEENEKWVNEEFDIESSALRWDLYKKFTDEMRIIGDDKSGIHKLSITFYSPDLALDWATKYYQTVNSVMRQEKLSILEKNIKNLETQILSNASANLRERLYDIQSQQIKAKIIIEASPDFILKPIGKFLPPYERSFPRKTIIVTGLTVAGFVLLILCLCIYRIYFQQKKI